MGFENGTVTSTAEATKFSISRSIARLYLLLTYSGFAAYKQATRPPNGVIPTRSPIPKTANHRLKHLKQSFAINSQVSMWVAPASKAVYAFAMAVRYVDIGRVV